MNVIPLRNHGGKRPGAGRKPPSPEQIEQKMEVVTKELVFPALCMAFKAEPGRFNERYLSVELSKVDIKLAYGLLGLQVWCQYFKQDKIGGRDRNGVGYKTRWVLHLGSYDIAKLLVESLGHTIKDLPDLELPFDAIQARLDAIKVRREARQQRAVLKAQSRRTGTAAT